MGAGHLDCGKPGSGAGHSRGWWRCWRLNHGCLQRQDRGGRRQAAAARRQTGRVSADLGHSCAERRIDGQVELVSE